MSGQSGLNWHGSAALVLIGSLCCGGIAGGAENSSSESGISDPPLTSDLLSRINSTASRRYIYRRLSQNADDARHLTLLIALHLDNEDYTAAEYWLNHARDHGIPVPAWQRILLAIQKQDLPSLRQMIDQWQKQLPADVIAEAMIALEQEEQAQRLAQDRLPLERDPARQLRLASMSDMLAMRNSAAAGLSVIGERLEGLDIASSEGFLYGRPTPRSPRNRAGVHLAASRLEYKAITGGEPISRRENRCDLNLQSSFKSGALSLSVNRTAGDYARNGGRISWAGNSMPLQWQGRLAWHATDYTSSHLRFNGSKHLAGIFVSGQSELNRVLLGMETHRYQDLLNTPVARGENVQLSITRTLVRSQWHWNVGIYGVNERNRLEAVVPTSFSDLGLTETGQIAPAKYRFAGISTRLATGESGWFEPQRNHSFSFYAWGGKSYPGGINGFGADLNAALSFTGSDKLSLNYTIGNSTSPGQPVQKGSTNHRLAITYLRHF